MLECVFNPMKDGIVNESCILWVGSETTLLIERSMVK